MKLLLAFPALMLLASCVGEAEPKLPLSSGTYKFEHRDAEFSAQPGFPVTLTVSGFSYTVVVRKPTNRPLFAPSDEGTFMWNQKLNVWVLGHQESDKNAPHAGGCQDDGPDTIDFPKKMIWTCTGSAVVADACASKSR